MHQHRQPARPPDPPHPWLVFLLYIYFSVMALQVLASLLSLGLSDKMTPRIYFGVVVILLPGLALAGCLWVLGLRRIYHRIMWDLGVFLCMGAISFLVTSWYALVHIYYHGNGASTQPLDRATDIGSTFVMAHASVMVTAPVMLELAHKAIGAAAFNIYPVVKVPLTRQIGQEKREL